MASNAALKPEEIRKWKEERKALIPVFLPQIALAIVLTTGWLYGGYYHCDCIPVPQSSDLKDGLIYYIRCCVFPCGLVLLFSLLAVMSKRVSTPSANPMAGKEHILQMEKNILMNTVEQIMLFLMVALVLVTYLDTFEMKIIPILAAHWVIGRILFNIGYRMGPQYRSLGMASNTMATIFSIGLSCYLVYTRGFMYGISDVSTIGAAGSPGTPVKAEL